MLIDEEPFVSARRRVQSGGSNTNDCKWKHGIVPSDAAKCYFIRLRSNREKSTYSRRISWAKAISARCAGKYSRVPSAIRGRAKRIKERTQKKKGDRPKNLNSCRRPPRDCCRRPLLLVIRWPWAGRDFSYRLRPGRSFCR